MVLEHLIANASNDLLAAVVDSSLSSAAFHRPARVISIKLDGTFLPEVLNCFLYFGVMDSWELLMVSNFVLGFPAKNTRSKVVSTIYGIETSRLAWQALGAFFVVPSTSHISLI
uniref:Uncharacterized protein n=1 Tax=Populus alba TaxID=43335 RepID=A0A4U5QZB3_POPAL|nr:hypothetical protein D5086_0000021600 [Populus alba]